MIVGVVWVSVGVATVGGVSYNLIPTPSPASSSSSSSSSSLGSSSLSESLSSSPIPPPLHKRHDDLFHPFSPGLSPIRSQSLSSSSCKPLTQATSFCPEFEGWQVAPFEGVEDLDGFLKGSVFTRKGVEEWIGRSLECRVGFEGSGRQEGEGEGEEVQVRGWVSYVCAQLAALSADVCEPWIPPPTRLVDTDPDEAPLQKRQFPTSTPRPLCLSSCNALAQSLLPLVTSAECNSTDEFQARLAVDGLFRECVRNEALNGIGNCIGARENESVLCGRLTVESACEGECRGAEVEGLCDAEVDGEGSEDGGKESGEEGEGDDGGGLASPLLSPDSRQIAIIVGSSVAAAVVVGILGYLLFMCIRNRQHAKKYGRLPAKTFGSAAGGRGAWWGWKGRGGKGTTKKETAAAGVGARGSKNLVAARGAGMVGGNGGTTAAAAVASTSAPRAPTTPDRRPPAPQPKPGPDGPYPYPTTTSTLTSPDVASRSHSTPTSTNPRSPPTPLNPVPPVLANAQRAMIGVVDRNERHDPRRQRASRVVSVASQTDFGGQLMEIYDVLNADDGAGEGRVAGHPALQSLPQHSKASCLPTHTPGSTTTAAAAVARSRDRQKLSRPQKRVSLSEPTTSTSKRPTATSTVPDTSRTTTTHPHARPRNFASSISRTSSRVSQHTQHTHSPSTSSSSTTTSSPIPHHVHERLKPFINLSLKRPLSASVRHSFDPELSDEILLVQGDEVLVRKVYDDDWCYGTNLSRYNSHGIFPLCHLRLDSFVRP